MATTTSNTPDTSDPSGTPGTPSGPTTTPVDPVRASGVETLLTLLGGVWLVIGLFIDGYAHTEIIDTETEDFITPWHGIFYSGFLFTTAVMAWMAMRRAGSGSPLTWLPAGYGWAAVGILVFSAGGIGDGIWHTLFGVETGIDALLSPTHLLLFTGMVLVLTAPVRAHWATGDRRRSWRASGTAVVATSVASALVVFFFTYAFGLAEPWPQEQLYDPVTELNEDIVAYGLASGYVATALLVAPVLALLRRQDLPTGSVVVLWLVPTVLNALAFGGSPGALVGAVLGALAAEVTLATRPFGLDRRWTITVAMTLGMAVTWSVYLLLADRGEGVRWPAELWSGQVVMSALVATGLSLLVFPSAPSAVTPAGGDLDSDGVVARP